MTGAGAASFASVLPEGGDLVPHHPSRGQRPGRADPVGPGAVDLTRQRTSSVHHTAPISPDPTDPDPDLPSEPLLTLPQVLTELAVPRSTFYRWRHLGDAPPAIRLPNGQLRFRRADLDAWVHDHTELVPENHP